MLYPFSGHSIGRTPSGEQRHAADAARHDHRIGADITRIGAQARHAIPRAHQSGHTRAEAQRDTRPALQQMGQRHAEAMAIAHFLARRVDRTDNVLPNAGQRRLQRNRGIAIQCLLFATKTGLIIEQATGRFVGCRITVHDQLAATREIETTALLPRVRTIDESLHQIARVERQAQ
jgi:glutathione S-transferase